MVIGHPLFIAMWVSSDQHSYFLHQASKGERGREREKKEKKEKKERKKNDKKKKKKKGEEEEEEKAGGRRREKGEREAGSFLQGGHSDLHMV